MSLSVTRRGNHNLGPRKMSAISYFVALLLVWPPLAFAAHFTHPTQGYSLDYPDSWHIDQAALDAGAPLLLTNFPTAQRRHGGLLPLHGMEINVRDFPSSADENALLVSDPGVQNVTRSVATINQREVVRADYDLGPVRYRVTSVVIHVGEKLFCILLTYAHTPPDSDETAVGEGALSQVISSLSGESQR